MSTTVTPGTEYPFGPLPADEAVAHYQRIMRDRPMTLTTMPYGGQVWVVHRQQAAREVLTDPRFVRQPFARGEREVPFMVEFPKFLKGTIQFTDPPEHTKLRRLVQRAISPRRVKTMRDSAVDYANSLIDAMVQSGPPANLVSQYALSLPIQMLANLLGVPVADREKFERWAMSMLAVSGIDEQTHAANLQELYTYLYELIALRRDDPREDLISSLANAREADESLTDDEILPIAMILLVGGFDNTANAICNGAHALLRNQYQLELFLSDIDRFAPSTVEELLRHGRFAVGGLHASTGGSVPFVASEDVVIDGQLVRAGETIAVDGTAANHDATMIPEPERFDITRTDNPHLGLSYGIHHCLGAPLARMEVQVGLSELFRRLPGLRMAGSVETDPDQLAKSVTNFPVAW